LSLETVKKQKQRQTMILVNSEKLNLSAADDKSHPQHEQAKEYRQGLATLKSLYKDGFITLTRTGYPRFVDGIDHRGRDMKDLKEPTPPAKYPLSTYFSHPKRGKELWECCIGNPKIMPGNLWAIGDRKNFTVEDRIIVDIAKEADFAFYLCYISSAVRGGHLKVADPKADAKARGDQRREKLERETAIWHTLSDEENLRKIASAYGVADVAKKEPDTIREELETVLKNNDMAKRKDASVKGTKEFLDELKITDSIRLSSFIRHWLDESKITYKEDGRYRVGDKIIAQVPHDYVLHKFSWLCNYYAAPNQVDKLQELMKDLVNKEYLDSITDEKDFRWIAKVMDIKGYYNQSPEKVKELVYSEFIV
jgi:hypothetical protein